MKIPIQLHPSFRWEGETHVDPIQTAPVHGHDSGPEFGGFRSPQNRVQLNFSGVSVESEIGKSFFL